MAVTKAPPRGHAARTERPRHEVRIGRQPDAQRIRGEDGTCDAEGRLAPTVAEKAHLEPRRAGRQTLRPPETYVDVAGSRISRGHEPLDDKRLAGPRNHDADEPRPRCAAGHEGDPECERPVAHHRPVAWLNIGNDHAGVVFEQPDSSQTLEVPRAKAELNEIIK